MVFNELTNAEGLAQYFRLYKESLSAQKNFHGFDTFFRRLFRGDFLLLKNRCHRRIYSWVENDRSRILVTHYTAKSPDLTHASSVGAILIDPRCEEQAIDEFRRKLAEKLPPKTLTPLNGHINLGFSFPAPGTPGTNIGFLTTAKNEKQEEFHRGMTKNRDYFALSARLDGAFCEKLQNEISRPPAGLSVRPISLGAFKKDVEVYNRLLNQCMHDHPGFYPLDFDEEWDLFKDLRFLLEKNYFLFLCYNNREIGFCLAVPDYNRIFQPGRDIKNFSRAVFSKRQLKRTRIIYSNILPEFQGRGWFKYVRHQVLLNMYRNGVEDVESSYIDQDNFRSMSNVRSTGADHSHTFHLYEMGRR